MTDPTPTSTMKRALRAGAFAALATLLAALLAACAGPLTNPPGLAEDGGTAHPTGFDTTLVTSYYQVSESENDDGSIDLRANYSGVTYQPRSSDYAGFEGWDLLEAPRSDSSRDDWLRINLARDAELVVLWEESARWLNGWDRAGEVAGKTIYRRSFEAGQAQLGSPGDGKGSYEVLIAETGGAPSAEPSLPPGWNGPAPQPNAACPDALHNLWLVEGPNGRMYGSWHPQIDPVYWCYYGHEHGTDPTLVGYDAAFRYVADQNNDQREQHEGFKGFGIQNVEADNGKRYHWYVNIHMTTSDISRICARTHTVVVSVVDADSGELMAELGYKGEYGSIKNNNDNSQLLQPQLAGCPNQQQIEAEMDAADLNVFKEVRVIQSDGSGNSGYEQWRGGLNETLGMDFRDSTGMHVDIRNPVTGCAGASCAQGVRTGSNGTRRTIRFSQLSIDYDRIAIFDTAFDGERDGVFYTDQYGERLVDEDDANAIRQYVAPGFRAQLDGGFETEDAWRALYVDDSHVQDLELEGGFGDIVTN